MNEYNLQLISIDALATSDECRKQLKRVGFQYISDVVEFLEQTRGGFGATITIRITEGCFAEVVEQLKLSGYWSED